MQCDSNSRFAVGPGREGDLPTHPVDPRFYLPHDENAPDLDPNDFEEFVLETKCS